MPNLYDILTFGGLLMLGVGLYLINPPLAFVVVGAMLFTLGMVAGKGARRR